MEDLEKNSNGGEFVVSMEEIRVLSESLSKPQLVDLLSQLYVSLYFLLISHFLSLIHYFVFFQEFHQEQSYIL
jgi:hypothetical protein